MATAVAPTGDVAFCLQSRAVSDGHAEDHLRVGFGRPGSVESVDLLDDGEGHEAACIDAAVDDDWVRWLVVRDAAVVLLSSTRASLGSSPDEEVVTTGRELASIGTIDWQTRGRMSTQGGVRYVLLSLGFGPNVLYADSGTGWKPVWPRWQAPQYVTGAPSFLLDGGGAFTPAFVTSLPSRNGVRRPGVYRQQGVPTALYSPAPFAFQAAPSAGRALYADSRASGETEIVVATSGVEGTTGLALARRDSIGRWTETAVFAPLHLSMRGDRSPPASIAHDRDGAPMIVFEDNVRPAEAEGRTTAIRVATLAGGSWQTATVAHQSAEVWRYFGPAAVNLSWGRPAAYFWAERSDPEPLVVLTYSESSASCVAGGVQ